MQEIAQDTGVLPPALAARPLLGEHLQTYLDAFYVLSPYRAIAGMGGYNPISFADVRGYADEFNIYDPDMRERLFVHVSALDRVYMAYAAKKSAEPKKLGRHQDIPAKS